jgi:ABC-type molybdenum transport system ATPase subunit/photorepair protein PhrA
LIDIQNADVAVDAGRLVVLRDITWSVRAGHHWFVTGPNGAGKTTLLRLLLGELGVGHGGSITRFGDEQPDSIWEIKKRIGYVSPELQTRYAENHSARDVIATGFAASVGWLQPVTAKQEKRVNELLALLDLQALADRGILQMSYGQARKVLLARALANQPRLLLLDEAFDGLDAGFREDIARVLEQISAQTSVVLVSHYDDDRLPFITHQLVLSRGQIAFAGRVSRSSHSIQPQKAKGKHD